MVTDTEKGNFSPENEMRTETQSECDIINFSFLIIFFRYVIFFFGLFCCCQWLCYFVCALFFSFFPIHLLMLFMLLRFRAMKENGNEKLFGALGVHHLCNWTTDKWNVFYIGRRMAAEWKWRNIIEQWVKSFYCCWECETSESDAVRVFDWFELCGWWLRAYHCGVCIC